MANPLSTQAFGAFLDFAETWQYLQFPAAPTGTKQNMLQRYIDAACAHAQGPEGANRPICPTEFTERHDGWSGEYIMVGHTPFLQLVMCREWMSTGGFVTLAESTPSSPTEGVQIDYATGRLMRTFSGYSWPRPFFPGSRNIEVTYIAGFNPVPPDLWRATVNLVKWWWTNEQQASRSVGPVPAGSEEYAQETFQLVPGVPASIAAVFHSYRQVGIG